jgi:alpha-galactosidase
VPRNCFIALPSASHPGCAIRETQDARRWAEATYADTGEDAYPDIRAKAPAYFENYPSLNDEFKYFKETGKWPESEEDFADVECTEPWAERGLFKIILEDFGYLPITTDSHFGEYVQWAYEVVDHKGILDFYTFYKMWLAHAEPKIELKLTERVVPIIEGILGDTGYEEAAVNVPNAGFIDNLPEWLAVEIPARVDKSGVHGVRLGELPKGFAGLLYNQIAVHDMTAEAVLTGSKAAVVQALLVDPIVDKYAAVKDLVDTMLTLQADYLGYLK